MIGTFCEASFSSLMGVLAEQRHVCCYCGGVFCTDCVSNTIPLPAGFDPAVIAMKPWVCDQCGGHIEKKKFVISVFSIGKRRPMNLAAKSHKEMLEWVHSFKEAKHLNSNEHVYMEGYLMKQDSTSKKYRSRYCTLHVNKLSFFKTFEKRAIAITKHCAFTRHEQAERALQVIASLHLHLLSLSLFLYV